MGRSRSGPGGFWPSGNHLGFYPQAFFPKAAGADYVSSQTLKNIEKHRKDFTVFSNLDDGAHGGHSGVHAFLSGGIRKEESGGFPEKNISLDQVAAEHSGSTARFPSITAGLAGGTDMCWTRTGVRIPPVNNPAPPFPGPFRSKFKSRARPGAKASGPSGKCPRCAS